MILSKIAYCLYVNSNKTQRLLGLEIATILVAYAPEM